MIPPIDLNDRNTFIRKTISLGQGEQRWNILARQAATVGGSGNLSPRSKVELDALTIVYKKPDGSQAEFEEIMLSEPAEFYRIKFQETINQGSSQGTVIAHSPAPALPGPSAIVERRNPVIERLQDVRNNSMAMDLALRGSLEKGILRAIVNPSKNMEWYKQRANEQTIEVLGSDFFDGLKYSYTTNLHLLSTAIHLKQHSAYSTILKLQTESTLLYEDQIGYNRSLERLILSFARENQQLLMTLCEMTEECGGNLDQIPDTFYDECREIVQSELQNSVRIFSLITEESKKYIKQIDGLEKKINTAIGELTSNKAKVIQIRTQLTLLSDAKVVLEEKKEEAEKQFKDFEELRVKEHAARKLEEHNWEYKLMPGLAFSGKKTHVVEAHLGSKEAFEQYTKITRELENKKKEIDNLRNELKLNMMKGGIHDTSDVSLNDAIDQLLLAITSIEKLRKSAVIRKKRCEIQLTDIREQMRTLQSGRTIATMRTVVNYIKGLHDKIFNAHIIWLSSHQQVRAIQLVRQEEEKHLNQWMQDLATGSNTTVESIKNALAPFETQEVENPINKILLSPSELLLEYEQLQDVPIARPSASSSSLTYLN